MADLDEYYDYSECYNEGYDEGYNKGYDEGHKEGYDDAVERCLSVLCENCSKADDCSGYCYIYDEMASLKE